MTKEHETRSQRKARRQKEYDEKRMLTLKKQFLEPEVWMNYEPVSEKEMEIISYRYTLCEVLRECYRLTDNPFIKKRLRVACAMGKSLCARITHFEGYRRWGVFQYMWNPNVKHERAKAKFEKWYGSWRDANQTVNTIQEEDEKENT